VSTAEEHREQLTAFDVVSAPVVIFVGNFGAGKTEIAVNLALGLKERGEDVALIDLDLIKPFFRSRLAREELEARGVELVVPKGDRFWADLPILVPEVRGILGRAQAGELRAVVDAGGDDIGSRVLGSLGDAVAQEHAEVLFVVNSNRPFAENVDALTVVLREVETAARLKVTGLVANNHLMEETTLPIVEAGIEMANAVAGRTGVPLRFVAALASVLNSNGGLSAAAWPCPVLPLERRILTDFQRRAAGLRRRSFAV
jgi:hypothetical protein